MQFFTDHPELYNDWKFSLLSELPPWALFFVAAAGLAAIVWSLRGVRDLRTPRRFAGLAALRIAAIVLLVLAVCEPALTLQRITHIKNRLVVLLDESRSMELPAAAGQASRIAQVRDHFDRNASQWDALRNRFVVETWRFSSRPVKSSSGNPEVNPAGNTTDLLAGLAEAANDTSGRKLSGVIIYSDGADNEKLAAWEPSPNGELPGELKGVLDRLKAPVSSFGAGAGGVFTDLAISRVAADDFAFVRNTMEIEAEIEAHGAIRGQIPVELLEDGALLATREVLLGEGRRKETVKFSVAPQRAGKFVYTVRTPVVSGDAVPGNNVRNFSIKIIRDKVRVLHVAGATSLDTRFLRQHLTRNPNVDLISFYILRTTDDDFSIPEREISLIQFPTRELFTQQLKTFDLVIFHNFDYGPYQMKQYLANVARFVREDGGGFVMIGGPRSFANGQYAMTAVGDLLPVELPFSAADTDADFHPRPTQAGRNHPITNLNIPGGPDGWMKLPAMPGVNIVGALRPGGIALLEHPTLQAGGAPMPVVSVREAGKGRVLAIGMDALWRWAFNGDNAAAEARLYDAFWANAIRWLIRDPDLAPVVISLDKPEVDINEPAGVDILALDRSYHPAPGADIRLTITPPEGDPFVKELQTGPDGRARLSWEAKSPGAARIRAAASLKGEALGEAEDVLIVRPASREMQRVAPRPDVLEAIARASGGVYQPLPDGSLDRLPLLDPEIARVDRKEHHPLWNTWIFLALIAACLGVEWFLRRKWGYL
ncbi:MAG: hypothetical protein GMKNLPBB_02385 [Myxococcota bacterium]|nr:hypothetical protein [Myxococcota bacterium]